MGLLYTRARFRGAAPSEEEFKAALAHQVGSAWKLEDFAAKGEFVEFTMPLNPVGFAYALKVVLELGGQFIDTRTGNTLDLRLPEYVQRPWFEWPWWTRAEIRIRSQFSTLPMERG